MRNGDFFRQRAVEDRYVVKDFAPANRLVMAAGYPGEGKSILDQTMFYSVTYGAPFADIFL